MADLMEMYTSSVSPRSSPSLPQHLMRLTPSDDLLHAPEIAESGSAERINRLETTMSAPTR